MEQDVLFWNLSIFKSIPRQGMKLLAPKSCTRFLSILKVDSRVVSIFLVAIFEASSVPRTPCLSYYFPLRRYFRYKFLIKRPSCSYNYRTRYNKLNVAASNGWITGRKCRRARVERRQNDVVAINLTDNAALM